MMCDYESVHSQEGGCYHYKSCQDTYDTVSLAELGANFGQLQVNNISQFALSELSDTNLRYLHRYTN